MNYDITKIKEEARTLVNELITTTQFESVLKGTMSAAQWEYQYHDVLRAAHIRYASGASRGVIWHETSKDFVFKFDLEDDGTCWKEFNVYRNACELGLDEYFAWCAPVYKHTYQVEGCDACSSITFYAMEYCDTNLERTSAKCIAALADRAYRFHPNWDRSDPSSHEAALSEASEWYSNADFCDDDASFEFAGIIWGEDAADEVQGLLWDNDVNDFHSGNWGWLNDHLVLTDYAGYHGGGDYDEEW